jgi:predicted O-methyltransferase YrrM
MADPLEIYKKYQLDPLHDMWEYSPYMRRIAQGNVLEIGVRYGVSTAAFILGVEANGGHLYSIDIKDCSNLYNHPQWTFLQGNSHDMDLSAVPFLDILFIDGDHSYSGTLADLIRFTPYVKRGGLIMCHDVAPIQDIPEYTESNGENITLAGVRRAWDEWLSNKNWPREILSGKFGLGVAGVP